MSDKNTDNSSDIKRMSSLLISGATMLADSCPDCNVPLFKKDDNVFCPKCNRKAVYVSSDSEIKQIEHKVSFSETLELLQDILTGKLNFLAQKLANCEELTEIQIIIQIIDLLIELTHKINKLQ
ncbi:MAG: Sjogren's syndrome/scleroderma autoantigen 1 family protein [Candidatus Hodarchaeota archaeon]